MTTPEQQPQNDFPEFSELEMESMFPMAEFPEFSELEMESMFPMAEFDEWKPEMDISEITTEITTFDFHEWATPSEPQQ